MSFRRRLTLACAAAVALAVVAAAALTYVLVRDQLREPDRRLAAPGDADGGGDAGAARGPRAAGPGPGERRARPLRARGPGRVHPADQPGRQGRDPVRRAARDARARQGARRRSPTASAARSSPTSIAPAARCACSRRSCPTAPSMQVARPIGEVNSTLATLRIGLGVIVLLGVAAALALARLATRAAVKPVADLTDAAEHVARTRDLTRRIARDGDDELSRLAGAFNTMLEALDDSQRAQRRLVADASHELRTPLTSLRTNLEVLARGGLAPADHERLRADLVAQLEELTLLVSDLVDLARDEEPCDGARDGRARRARRRGRRARAAARAGCRVRGGARADARRGRPRPPGPRGGEPARQRREARRRARGGGAARRGADRARPRAGHRRGRPAVRVRPLLPLDRRRAAARAPGSGSRSCGRPPRRTAAPCAPGPCPGGGAELTLALPRSATS